MTTKYKILRAVSQPATALRVAREMNVSEGRIHSMLKKFEKKELVQRIAYDDGDTADRWVLTLKGLHAAHRSEPGTANGIGYEVSHD